MYSLIDIVVLNVLLHALLRACFCLHSDMLLYSLFEHACCDN